MRYTLTIEQDCDYESDRGRGGDCNFGTLTFPSSRYLSSDSDDRFKKYSGGEIVDYLRSHDATEPVEDLDDDRFFFAPIGAYVHSGITVWLGSMQSLSTHGSCRWDSGTIGYIYCTSDKVRDEFDAHYPDDSSSERLARVEGLFEGEIRMLDSELQGDVYRYTIRDENGAVVDSCGGFVGDEGYCRTEGEAALEQHERRDKSGSARASHVPKGI